MRFVRYCLGILMAGMAFVAMPGHAANENNNVVDGMSFEVGGASMSSFTGWASSGTGTRTGSVLQAVII